MRKTSLIALVLSALLLPPAGARRDAAVPRAHVAQERGKASLSAVARLGEAMFFDPSLSASGKQSCASCHDPTHGFAPANGRAVQLGGSDLTTPGIRAVPSLAYLTTTPPFSVGPESLYEAEPQLADAGPPAATSRSAKSRGAASDMVPRGGFFWDGRADTLQEQAIGPLLSPFEMANPDAAAVYRRLQVAPYFGDFAKLFGRAVITDPAAALAEAEFALARFQIEDRRFHAFTSKYDYYLAGQALLSPAEQRGLKLFEDPAKGNCAACHPDRPSRDGKPPLFTDHEFEALGVPRNPAIPANRDPARFDLGICGPLRDDAAAHDPANCGLFKTPTLRNAALRHVFFHNGIYRDLHDVVRFYLERETSPDRIYPRRPDGSVDVYDDLPSRYRANIDRIDAPFDRKSGVAPALTPREIEDLVAFLGALTDGYDPQAAKRDQSGAPAGGNLRARLRASVRARP